MIQTFQDLDAWKEAHVLAIMVYKVTRIFPRDELFALTSQLRRAVVSITSNIAEGFSRQSYREKVQFYSIAQGSVTEVQSQVLIAKDINYLEEKEFHAIFNQSVRVHKILNGLIKKSKDFSQS